MTTQPLNETIVKYAELLSAKALHCHGVGEKYVLKGTFIEWLQDFMHLIISPILGSKKHESVPDRARHETSLTRF